MRISAVGGWPVVAGVVCTVGATTVTAHPCRVLVVASWRIVVQLVSDFAPLAQVIGMTATTLSDVSGTPSVEQAGTVLVPVGVRTQAQYAFVPSPELAMMLAATALAFLRDGR